ncbi:glycoside hydrolase family 31 protein [Diplocloster modestus]|uniref:Alpha-glucosidase n=1 Tax=Diplocloster modestus TaxID=2850322 RepID=A0ABS6KDJ2_9FIRM|nr:TIM-barrel domain-containing protein [Diplocloster modestus]MBU9728584.1 alpha-glucosidase [Diplocloster modestus]
MIQKYVFGTPFETEAVVKDIPAVNGEPAYGCISTENGFRYTYRMDCEDKIYGLGEANRGINKRGFRYISDCTDNPEHTEDAVSMYGAHNFLIVSGKDTFGMFIDYPSRLTFDIGYSERNRLEITCEEANLYLYLIRGDSIYDIVKQFRRMIGRSYIPPKFAFGFGQSRWGYTTEEDFRSVAREYRENHIPMDLLYMDIDYMERFKDFTVNKESFPDFAQFVSDMKDVQIHLVPIIDAGVKVEKGYAVYEEGLEKGYFCKKEDGSEFTAAVWPGWTHFPDVLNPEAREWFGNKYQLLLSQGIDGFWNDMNEPAIFYSEEGLCEAKEFMREFLQDSEQFSPFAITDMAQSLANNPKDYKRFYHEVNGQKVRHDKVHNLFGYNMTRAAGEAFEKLSPDKRILLFSRSSYIGMHRYGGIWTGDNKSWWSHILLNLKMLPSLNMCGFLYVGADLGGFGCDTTRDLLLRWLALGVFTPLMRNHAALGTRLQECCRFEGLEDFRHVIGVRYRLIPYLYSEYMKAALNDEMMFKPLAFEYPQDSMACQVEDQLLVGNEIMIAPVYTQNATGRYVYLPEEMKFIKFLPDGNIREEILEKGHHYVEIALNEVPLFIRKGKSIPVGAAAETIEEISGVTLEYVGCPGAFYELYDDDGITPINN